MLKYTLLFFIGQELLDLGTHFRTTVITHYALQCTSRLGTQYFLAISELLFWKRMKITWTNLLLEFTRI